MARNLHKVPGPCDIKRFCKFNQLHEVSVRKSVTVHLTVLSVDAGAFSLENPWLTILCGFLC